MPLYRLRLTMNRTVGDDVQWGYGIDGPAINDGILGALVDRYQVAWTTNACPGEMAPLDWSLIEAFPAEGGAAVAVTAVNPTYQMGTGNAGPGEVAAVVSAEIDTVRGVRPRGRTFYGPVTSGELGDPRMDDVLIGNLGNFATDWHEELVNEGYTPVVISTQLDNAPRPSPVGLPIIRYSLDNAWDTMRSRGVEANGRSTFIPNPA